MTHFLLCPYNFKSRLRAWAFPSMSLLALGLMADEGVTARLNTASQDTYWCQIKKNEGFVAWHLWDSLPGDQCLGTLFVVQVSVAAVKPRIMKRMKEDYRPPRDRPGHTHANLPAWTQSGQRPEDFQIAEETINIISSFKTYDYSRLQVLLSLVEW